MTTSLQFRVNSLPPHSFSYIPVFHDPVVVPIVIANPVSHDENPVVEFVSATTVVVVHSTGVELELVAGGIDGHTETHTHTHTQQLLHEWSFKNELINDFRDVMSDIW